MSLALQSTDDADAGQALLGQVRSLGPAFAARAAEFEALRRMPQDVVDELRRIGVFRMYTPRSHGGLELDFPTTLEVMVELARIDGSLGWIAMIGAGSQSFLPKLPRETYERIHADGPDVIVAGSAAPVAFAEVVGGGFRISGRWPFASGCQHADVIFAGVVVTKDGTPLPGRAPGMPMIRHFALPAGEWTIEDTWHVSGLKGTGSCHISVKDKFVAEENVFEFGGTACVPGPLYQAPLQLVPLMHGAPAIGIAEGAVEDLCALAGSGKTQFGSPSSMRDSLLFQAELGKLATDVWAARALQEHWMTQVWDRLVAGDLGPPEDAVKGGQVAPWVTVACAKAVDGLHALGGGSALYSDSPLQRRLRDIHAASQHTVVQPRHYASAGAVRLGHPPPPSRL